MEYAIAFLGTLFTMFNAKYINSVDAAKITMIEMLGGVILISLYFLIIGDYSVFITPLIANDIIYLLLLGTICTAGIFVWMTEIMRHITQVCSNYGDKFRAYLQHNYWNNNI